MANKYFNIPLQAVDLNINNDNKNTTNTINESGGGGGWGTDTNIGNKSTLRDLSGPGKYAHISVPTTLKTINQDTSTTSQLKATNANNLPKPGSTFLNYGDSNRPGEYQTNATKLSQLGKGMTGTVTDKNTGLAFTGRAEDAAKFFSTPSYTKEQLAGMKEIYNRNNPDMSNFKVASSMPLSMIKPPVYGSHGGGWKSRLALYKADLDAYNQATGQQLQANIEQMREAGAGLKTLAQAKQLDFENKLAAQNAQETSALNKLKLAQGQREDTYQSKVEAARTAYMENPSEENKVRLSNLLYDPNKAKQPDVRVVDKFDPLTGEKIGQSILRDNGSGNYIDVTPKANEHPAIMFLRNNNTPQNRALFKKKYGQLPEGFEE